MNRRRFLSALAAGAGACMAAPQTQAIPLQLFPTKRPRHLIVLWMSGGPSHLDLWDIKVGSANQAFKPIDTAAPGIHIGELMENVAKEFKNLSIVRSLDSRDGDQTRATFRMNHVSPPSMTGVQVPGIGAVASHYLGRASATLPRCVVIHGSTGFGDAGFLGTRLAGFPVLNAGSAPENLSMPALGDARTTRQRGEFRRELLDLLDSAYAEQLDSPLPEKAEPKPTRNAARDLRTLHAQAQDLSLRTNRAVFEFTDPDVAKLANRFGDGSFGRGCLLAAKLVQAGTAAVQVSLGGWDMHGDIAAGTTLKARELDRGFGGLMAELRETGLIHETVVLCAAPFGRMARNRLLGGSVPWSKGWSVVLGGCGIGGVEYGKTNADGTEIVENAVSVEQLYATIYTALGIDLNDVDLNDNLGHRFYIAGEKKNAAPIKELLKSAP